MVTRLVPLFAFWIAGCSLVNASSMHTSGRGADAGPAPDAPPAAPLLRFAHLSRDTGPLDVYADGALLSAGEAFPEVGSPQAVPAGMVTFRVQRAGTSDVLLERAFETEPGRAYTLTFYGDEIDAPFDRTLDMLLLDDDASGLDVTRSIRLAVVHVASPVVAGQLVAVMDGGNTLLADDFGFAAVARLLELPSTRYTVGFDAGADGVVDVNFDLPVLVPGTYANVFVATRPDDSVFLLVNTGPGATLVIDGYIR